MKRCTLIHAYRTIFSKYPDVRILDISTNIYSKSDVIAKQRKLRNSNHETQNKKEIQID